MDDRAAKLAKLAEKRKQQATEEEKKLQAPARETNEKTAMDKTKASMPKKNGDAKSTAAAPRSAWPPRPSNAVTASSKSSNKEMPKKRPLPPRKPNRPGSNRDEDVEDGFIVYTDEEESENDASSNSDEEGSSEEEAKPARKKNKVETVPKKDAKKTRTSKESDDDPSLSEGEDDLLGELEFIDTSNIIRRPRHLDQTWYNPPERRLAFFFRLE